MTTSDQLTRWMRHDDTFVGVYALDRLPAMALGGSMIVNTDTHSLPGQHWIAVRTLHDHAWIFDPLAFPPIPALCNHLINQWHINILHYCDVSIQPLTAQSCGQHCVYFLYTLSGAPSEEVVMKFIHGL